jgi:hypothetical protein
MLGPTATATDNKTRHAKPAAFNIGASPESETRPRSTGTHQLRVRKGPLALWFGGPGPRVSCWVVLIDASKANAILRTEQACRHATSLALAVCIDVYEVLSDWSSPGEPPLALWAAGCVPCWVVQIDKSAFQKKCFSIGPLASAGPALRIWTAGAGYSPPTGGLRILGRAGGAT